MHEMSSLITAVIGKVCIIKLNTNAGPRTNRNILRRGGTIPDPWRTILNRRYTGLGSRGYYKPISDAKLQYCLCIFMGEVVSGE